MRRSSNGRTLGRASTDAGAACTPAPMISQQARLHARQQPHSRSAAAPGVRSAVMAVPSGRGSRAEICARGNRHYQIRAWWVGRPSGPLPGNTLTELDGEFLIALIRGHGEQEAGGGNRDAGGVRRVDQARARALKASPSAAGRASGSNSRSTGEEDNVTRFIGRPPALAAHDRLTPLPRATCAPGLRSLASSTW